MLYGSDRKFIARMHHVAAQQRYRWRAFRWELQARLRRCSAILLEPYGAQADTSRPGWALGDVVKEYQRTKSKPVIDWRIAIAGVIAKWLHEPDGMHQVVIADREAPGVLVDHFSEFAHRTKIAAAQFHESYPVAVVLYQGGGVAGYIVIGPTH